MRITESIKQKIKAFKGSKYVLSGESLHNEDIFVLVEILKTKANIQYLDVSCNKITEEGALKLAELTHLIHLDISSNNITNKAVMLLLKNKNLVSLDCSYNPKLDNQLGNEIISQSIIHHVMLKFIGTKISSDILDKINNCCFRIRENLDTLPKPEDLEGEHKEISSNSKHSSPSAVHPRSTPTPSTSTSDENIEESTAQAIAKPKKTNSEKLYLFLRLHCLFRKKAEEIKPKKKVRDGLRPVV